jgi:hypothetical protein
MNRVELKNKAKELVRGNKWYLWKPLVFVGLAVLVIEMIAFGLDYALGMVKVETTVVMGIESTNFSGGVFTWIVSIFTTLAGSAFSVGYAHYVLSFIRGTRLELSDVIDFMKKNWLIAFLVSFWTGLIVLVGSILLVIPGIIAAIGLMFYQEVCADNLELKAMDMIHKAWEMTKGHKMELFVLGLSFIGWCIVAGFTLGILYLWLTPYMIVTFTLAYEELKK